MDYLCRIFLIILFMSINGSIFMLIWMLLNKLCGKLLRTDFIYYLLKLVMVSFFIPVIYIIFIFKSYKEFGRQNYLVFFTKTMRLIFLPALTIIFIMFLYEIYKCIKGINRLTVIKEKRQEIDAHTRKIYDEICDKIKIKRKLEIYKLPNTPSPFIYGYLNPVIYLTDDDMEDDDLRIALTHELFHYKKKDELWKIIANIICCMHWFNPLAWLVREEYKMWAEAEVDFNCFKYGGFDIEEYFDGIIRMAQKVQKRFLNFLSFAGSRSQLYKRAIIMSKYSQNKIKPLMLMAIGAVSVFIVIFSIDKTSDAAGYIFSGMFVNTSVEFKDDAIYYGDGYIEYIRKSSDIKSEERKVVDAFARDEIDYGDVIDIDLNLEKNESRKVIKTYLNKDKTLLFAFMMEEENTGVRVEIYEPDGKVRCIEADYLLNYMYDVSKDGNYEICITNIGEDKLKITGSIVYETR